MWKSLKQRHVNDMSAMSTFSCHLVHFYGIPLKYHVYRFAISTKTMKLQSSYATKILTYKIISNISNLILFLCLLYFIQNIFCWIKILKTSRYRKLLYIYLLFIFNCLDEKYCTKSHATSLDEYEASLQSKVFCY